MTSKAVADFLAAHGLTPGATGRRSRGSSLDKVEDEMRELASGGASINEMLRYLWLHHQIKPARSGFAAWLVRRGIGSSGRDLGPSPSKVEGRQTNATSTAGFAVHLAPPKRTATHSVHLRRQPMPSEELATTQKQADRPESRVKASLERQRHAHGARRSSTLPASMQFSELLAANRKQGEAAAACARAPAPDPIASLERRPLADAETEQETPSRQKIT